MGEKDNWKADITTILCDEAMLSFPPSFATYVNVYVHIEPLCISGNKALSWS